MPGAHNHLLAICITLDLFEEYMRILLAAILLLSLPASASGWSQTGNVVEVYNLGWTVMIKLDGAFVDRSDGACTGVDYYSIDKSSSNFEPIFAQILTAYAAGKPTKMWISGACSGQGKVYQNISSIRNY